MEDSFKVNVFGHLMTYKHFLPLVPTKKPGQSEDAKQEDAGTEFLRGNKSFLVSLSARVGSIEDNQRGGWYSYRASKAATNQVIRTLARELKYKPQIPAMAIAYHPGTLNTDLAAPYTKGQTPENTKGFFEPEEAAKNLLKVLEGLKDDEDSGSFLAYDGSRVPW